MKLRKAIFKAIEHGDSRGIEIAIKGRVLAAEIERDNEALRWACCHGRASGQLKGAAVGKPQQPRRDNTNDDRVGLAVEVCGRPELPRAFAGT